MGRFPAYNPNLAILREEPRHGRLLRLLCIRRTTPCFEVLECDGNLTPQGRKTELWKQSEICDKDATKSLREGGRLLPVAI